MDLSRLESLTGKDKLSIIKNLNILIIGIGGVGGYTLEGLVRSGVENITIIDKDVIDASNLNRQIITHSENIGNSKVEEAVKRAKMINPSININGIMENLTSDNLENFINGYDYIVDACDDVAVKVELMKYTYKNKIKLISSMGTAKRIDATKLKVSTLDKTSYCPLAKKIRRSLSKEEQKYVKVIYSDEESVNTNVLGSNSYVPAVAGLFIAGEIIKEVINH